jgi:hypothetical protein
VVVGHVRSLFAFVSVKKAKDSDDVLAGLSLSRN